MSSRSIDATQLRPTKLGLNMNPQAQSNASETQGQLVDRSNAVARWQVKLALAAGAAVPAGLLLVADPASAFTSGEAGFGGTAFAAEGFDDGPGIVAITETAGPEDTEVSAPSQSWEQSFDLWGDGGEFAVTDASMRDSSVLGGTVLDSTVLDSTVLDSTGTGGKTWGQTAQDVDSAEGAASVLRDSVETDELDAPLDPGVVRLLESHDIDPNDAYALKPGTYGYEFALDAADAHAELGNLRKANSIRAGLAAERATAVLEMPEGAHGGLIGGEVFIDVSQKPIPIIDMVAHEFTHRDQFLGADPLDEVDSYASGLVAGSWSANAPEALPEGVENAARLVTELYDGYGIFEPEHIASAIAARTLEYLREHDSGSSWTAAEHQLDDLVFDQTITDAEVRSAFNLPAGSDVSYETNPDGSVLVARPEGDVLLRINPDTSRSFGRSSHVDQAHYEDTFYVDDDNKTHLISRTMIDYTTNVVTISSEITNSEKVVYQDGSQVLFQFNEARDAAYRLTLDAGGQLSIDSLEIVESGD